ncbi:hypothetical protein GOODEAATRI_025797, partial [Goodea atripinnis]
DDLASLSLPPEHNSLVFVTFQFREIVTKNFDQVSSCLLEPGPSIRVGLTEPCRLSVLKVYPFTVAGNAVGSPRKQNGR